MDAMYTIETIAEPPCKIDGCLAVVPVALPGDDARSPDGAAEVIARIVPSAWDSLPCVSCGGAPAWLEAQLVLLRERVSDEVRLLRPVLAVGDAARMLGVSRKRLENLIYEEKARLGRMPDFVCDAGGRMKRRILRDELLEWMRARQKKRGRPSKRMPQ